MKRKLCRGRCTYIGGPNEKLNHCRKKNGISYICTLPKNHKGAHVACGCGNHNLYTWEEEKP